MHRLRSLALLLPALAIAACGDDAGAGGDGVAVVATTTHVTDLVRSVAGDRADVHGLIPANADPHDYEPRPADAKQLSGATLVVRAGGEIDGWLDDTIEGAGGDPTVLALIDHVETRAGGHSHGPGEDEHGDEDVDPHWWQDPRNALRAVDAIRAALTEADPGGRAAYAANARAYTARLRELDAAVARCIEQIPAAQRRLVTTHDALGYYARRYGLDVIGTVIPSLSTQGQPSSKDTERLVDDIERTGVRTVFAESAVDQRVERAIADQAGVRLGDELWTDSLDEGGGPAGSYVGAIAANTRSIAAGLGDVRCRGLDAMR